MSPLIIHGRAIERMYGVDERRAIEGEEKNGKLIVSKYISLSIIYLSTLTTLLNKINKKKCIIEEGE